MWLCRIHGTRSGGSLHGGGHVLWQEVWPVEPGGDSVHHAQWLPSFCGQLWHRLWLGQRRSLQSLPGECACPGHVGGAELSWELWGQDLLSWRAVPDTGRELGGSSVTEKGGWQYRTWMIPISKVRLGNCLSFLLLWDLRASPHPLPYLGILPCSVILGLLYGSHCNSSGKSWTLGGLLCRAWDYFLKTEYFRCPLRGGEKCFQQTVNCLHLRLHWATLCSFLSLSIRRLDVSGVALLSRWIKVSEKSHLRNILVEVYFNWIIFPLLEQAFWEHSGRQIWISWQGLVTYFLGGQRSHLKAAGLWCQRTT